MKINMSGGIASAKRASMKARIAESKALVLRLGEKRDAEIRAMLGVSSEPDILASLEAAGIDWEWAEDGALSVLDSEKLEAFLSAEKPVAPKMKRMKEVEVRA